MLLTTHRRIAFFSTPTLSSRGVLLIQPAAIMLHSLPESASFNSIRLDTATICSQTTFDQRRQVDTDSKQGSHMIYKGHANSVIKQSTGHRSVQTNDTLHLTSSDFHTDLDHIIRSVSAAPTAQAFSSSPPAQLTPAVCRQLVTRICKLHLRFDFITTHSLRMRFCRSSDMYSADTDFKPTRQLCISPVK